MAPSRSSKKPKISALAAAAAAARLNDEQAQELCRHVKLLGLTAKLAHMGHINYFATLYDRPPEVIQAFIRVAIKDQAPVSGEIRVNDLNTSGSGVGMRKMYLARINPIRFGCLWVSWVSSDKPGRIQPGIYELSVESYLELKELPVNIKKTR
ncbi:hypothetical protein BDR26DRAFT_855011 [Obelidium mucronatum]|nr:hypothetical protein BDR26DRAFT_855011 [Obelidium mucronatum]